MNENNINYGLLDNVKQPKLAQTLIKLREVFVEYINETDRTYKKYGVPDKLSDDFIREYEKLTNIITKSMTTIIDAEIGEAIKTDFEASIASK